ncbi:uncharacterized protein LOC116618907 [Nematostella vectensis]|uniref:uncharacterized protein LOC116618907 n=1 Tax=Nematostella vectensis TaxID=45351 RepID=UPI0013905651|nr:uncharacterized protein LOC116618907 [Nematostella vectensis]
MKVTVFLALVGIFLAVFYQVDGGGGEATEMTDQDVEDEVRSRPVKEEDKQVDTKQKRSPWFFRRPKPTTQPPPPKAPKPGETFIEEMIDGIEAAGKNIKLGR